MSRRVPHRGRIIPILFFTFAAGVGLGWWARVQLTQVAIVHPGDVSLPTGTSGETRDVPGSINRDAPPDAGARAPMTAPEPSIAAPRSTGSQPHLRLPIDGADVQAMNGQFGESRERGARGHEAVDILAPRNTPIHAVDDGRIEKLFYSKQGGITVYQFDPTGRYCYYYAHLERYTDGLREQQAVSRGEVLGYVGTTGNAPANTPHLHFAIFELTPEKHWWQGTPIDPWTIFTH